MKTGKTSINIAGTTITIGYAIHDNEYTEWWPDVYAYTDVLDQLIRCAYSEVVLHNINMEELRKEYAEEESNAAVQIEFEQTEMTYD